MALALGKSLQWVDDLPYSEFAEWQQYDELFPFGDEREDWRAGIIASQIVNMASSKNNAKPDDFVLKPPKTQKQKDAELRDMLRGAAK